MEKETVPGAESTPPVGDTATSHHPFRHGDTPSTGYTPPPNSCQLWVPKKCNAVYVNGVKIEKKLIQKAWDYDAYGWNILFETEPEVKGGSIGMLIPDMNWKGPQPK